MPGYILLNADVTDQAGYEEFKRLAEVLIPKFGGRYLARGGKVETVEGEWLPRIVLLEFPSFDEAMDFYNSEGYKEAQDIRLRTSISRVAIFEGV